MQKGINASISTSKFANDLKEADVIPICKKKSKLSKENYMSISILLNISKVYERCLYDQISKSLKLDFPSFSAVFERVIVHSTVY